MMQQDSKQINAKMIGKLTPTTGFVNVGEFFVCNCGIPLAKRINLHEYDVSKFHNGEKGTANIQFEGGILKIKCKRCRRGFNYIQVKESIAS